MIFPESGSGYLVVHHQEVNIINITGHQMPVAPDNSQRKSNSFCVPVVTMAEAATETSTGGCFLPTTAARRESRP